MRLQLQHARKPLRLVTGLALVCLPAVAAPADEGTSRDVPSPGVFRTVAAPAIPPPSAPVIAQAQGPIVRVYKDSNAWFGENRDHATLLALGKTVGQNYFIHPLVELADGIPPGTSVVLLPSNGVGSATATARQNGAAAQAALEAFVRQGGVLIVDMGDNDRQGGYRAPGSAGTPAYVFPDRTGSDCRNATLFAGALGSDGLLGTPDDHPIVRGFDGVAGTDDDLTNDNIDLVSSCWISHGNLSDGITLPPQATPLMSARFGGVETPILAEYCLGTGLVIVDTITKEYRAHQGPQGGGSGPTYFMTNLLSYAMAGTAGRCTCDTAAIIDLAEAIRDRAVAEATDSGGEVHLSCAEYNILFEAVSRKTGVPASILKAYAFGEGLANYYVDNCPRHFLEPSLRVAPDLPNQEICSRYIGSPDWPVVSTCDTTSCPHARELIAKLNTEPLAHVAVGRDTASLGFGIMQITLDTSNMVEPLFTVERRQSLPAPSCGHLDGLFPAFAENDRITANPAQMARPHGPHMVGVAHDSRLCREDASCTPMSECTFVQCNNGNLNALDVTKVIYDPLYNILVGAQAMIYKSFWTTGGRPRLAADDHFLDYFDEDEWPGYGRILVSGPLLTSASEDEWIRYAADLKGTPKNCRGLQGAEWTNCRVAFMRSALTEDFPNLPATCAR